MCIHKKNQTNKYFHLSLLKNALKYLVDYTKKQTNKYFVAKDDMYMHQNMAQVHEPEKQILVCFLQLSQMA